MKDFYWVLKFRVDYYLFISTPQSIKTHNLARQHLDFCSIKETITVSIILRVMHI